jgi:PTH1 family peptidyl-tRNA hydrolase
VKKYLIAGLGNIGAEYEETRHNIGFKTLDFLAKRSGVFFATDRLAFKAEYNIKGRKIILIKPTTYMNLSGKAVDYWLKQENIPQENLLVILDDIALNMGVLRLKTTGSPGGHNGLKNIEALLATQKYARLRMGIGGDFPKGAQVDYVLGEWSAAENDLLPSFIEKAADATESFVLAGPQNTMNLFNTK